MTSSLFLSDIFTEDELITFDTFVEKNTALKKTNFTNKDIDENDSIYGINDLKGSEKNLGDFIYKKLVKYLDKYIFQTKDRILYDDIGNEWYIVGYSNDIYFGFYEMGHQCDVHTDDTNVYIDETSGKKTYEMFTCLIYLSTQMFSGQTAIYHDTSNYSEVVLPRRGKCLLFNHTNPHESLLLRERNKKWISIILLVQKKDKSTKKRKFV